MAIDEVKTLVSAEFGSIFLLDNKNLIRVYSTVPEKAQVVPRPNGNSVKALKSNKIVVVKDKDIKSVYPQFLDFGIRSVVYMPLTYKNKTIGLLTVTSKEPSHFNAQKIRILQVYCSLVTLAIRNVELYSDTQKALETRDAFIAMASHELKTPLTSILGYTQLIESKQKLNKQFSPEWISEMHQQAQKLSILINEFLQTDYIKRSELKHDSRKFSLSDIISQAVVAYRFRTGNTTIRFRSRPRISDRLVCDKDKLLTALMTLFSMLRRVVDKNKEIAIDLSRSKKTWNLNLTWANSPSESTALFELFNSRDINLEFVRKIIAQHKGGLGLENISSKTGELNIMLPF